jgi:hypothetical protein
MTLDRIRDFLSYDPATGAFHWLRLPPHCSTAKVGERAGYVPENGRRVIGYRGRHYRAAHLAWWWVYGKWPQREIDHRDRDTQNDRIDNLRLATKTQNQGNVARQSNHKSGFRGVCVHRMTGRWRAQISVDYRQEYLGLFDSAEDAAHAYDAAAKKHFGEFAFLNFPIG